MARAAWTLFFVLAVHCMALRGALANNGVGVDQCYRDPQIQKPAGVMAWGVEGYTTLPSGYSPILDGWREVERLTGETIEQTRQEALNWFAERFGLATTLLYSDPVTGLGVLPQGYLVPSLLNVSGDYHLWAQSGHDYLTGITCPTLSVIEWIWFSDPAFAGVPYNGTYGQWYSSTGTTSNITTLDVVSIGRYIVKGTNGPHASKVFPFATWFPVRKAPEGAYIVENKIYDPDTRTWGYGQSKYDFYIPPGQTKTYIQIRNLMKFPFVEPPPLPSAYAA